MLFYLVDIFVVLMMLLQGGQLTSRAVPRLRGGPPWREEADFDTFYMSFRWERSLPLLGWEFPLGNSIGHFAGITVLLLCSNLGCGIALC